MAKHDPNTRPSIPVTRRVLALGAGAFSAIGLVAGAAASVPEPHPDAELLAICAEAALADDRAMAACRQHRAFAGDDARQIEALEESDRHFDRFCDLIERAAAIPARTVDGMRAKADLVLRDAESAFKGDDNPCRLILCEIAGRT